MLPTGFSYLPYRQFRNAYNGHFMVYLSYLPYRQFRKDVTRINERKLLVICRIGSLEKSMRRDISSVLVICRIGSLENIP